MKLTLAGLLILSLLFAAHASEVYAEGVGIDESIVTYVASNEGETMRVEGAPAVESQKMAGAASDDSWKFELTPYLWTFGIDGDFVVKGVEGDVDLDFGDILSVTDFALALRGEAWHGPLGFTLDFTYLKASEKADQAPLVLADVGLEMLILELSASYKFESRLCPQPEDERLWTFEPTVGLRYVGVEADVDLSFGPFPGPSGDGSQNWIEPFIGFRSGVDLTERLSMGLGFNIGGFSIGSRLTWVAWAGFDYRFSDLISGKIGYKLMDIDYSDGSGRNRFVMDAMLQGVWIGISFHF